MQRIIVIVLGAGFAGLWSAIGAARALDERGIGRDRVQVTMVNATRWHCIYEAAIRLGAHLAGLVRRPRSAGRDTVLVVGAGPGIEVATETPGRLRAALGVGADPKTQPRVILADRADIGSDVGESRDRSLQRRWKRCTWKRARGLRLRRSTPAARC